MAAAAALIIVFGNKIEVMEKRVNNIAICFVGTARSLEHTHINIKKNLVDSVGECDIFAFLAQNKHSSKFQKYFHNVLLQ